MLRFLLPLRLMMLCASLGALLGAAIMLWLAAVKLAHGAEVLWTIGSAAAGDITAAVMGATDAFLFGVVLMIFAYAIAFGFAFQPKGEESDRLPKWMHVEGACGRCTIKEGSERVRLRPSRRAVRPPS